MQIVINNGMPRIAMYSVVSQGNILIRVIVGQVIDFREKSITYFDSMGGSNQKCLQTLKDYLVSESEDKKKSTYDVANWKLVNKIADVRCDYSLCTTPKSVTSGGVNFCGIAPEQHSKIHRSGGEPLATP